MEKKGILAVGIIQRGGLLCATYELLGAGRTLAESLQEPLNAVILGSRAKEFAQDLIERGASRVYLAENPALDNFNDEIHTQAVAQLCEKEGFSKILLPSGVAGRSLAARLSVKLQAGLVAEACEIYQNQMGLRAKRYHYSGNVISEVEFRTPVQILTIQAMVFAPAERQAGKTGETIPFEFSPQGPVHMEFLSFKPEESTEVDLGNAERVISGGRGLGNAEGFKLIRDFARTIGAAVGASRAVVDSGWIAYRHQVGLTGRAVRPKLYIACGISGQIQHLAGMSSSGTIVAINTDPDCPIMQIASISLVGDLGELVPLIIEEIRKRKGSVVTGTA
jgi:electron transfer flavoprotein alpha subunit